MDVENDESVFDRIDSIVFCCFDIGNWRLYKNIIPKVFPSENKKYNYLWTDKLKRMKSKNKSKNENENQMDLIGSMENSGNINKFVSVCDKELLPNDLDVTEYNLRCIVRHLGNNYSSGHYIVDVLNVKRSDGDDKDKEKLKDIEHKWERHDDQYVSDITETLLRMIKHKRMHIYFFIYIIQ